MTQQPFCIRATRQRVIALVMVGLALAAVAAAYRWGTIDLARWRQLLLAGALALSVMVAYRFPIYIRHNTKIVITSIPLFLMASVLPPALAATAACASILGGELIARVAVRHRLAGWGAYPSDIAINTGRWVLIVLAGSLIAHIPLPIHGSVLRDLPFMGAALLFWLGDVLTLPAVLAPKSDTNWLVTGEKPWTIIRDSIRESGAAEAGQYLAGILAVLLAMQQVWALLMLVVPAGLVCLAYKKEVDTSAFNLLEGLADTIDLRDRNTGGHSHRVATLVEHVLEELGMHGPEARQIITAARLHDIGKIAMPDSILQKPGPLCEEEWTLIQTCPDQAEELLRDYPDFARGIEMVRHHHERWDGAGYPRQLAETEIPFGARLIAIADSYDAMTSDRPYRRAMTPQGAAAVLRHGRGTQWDPQLVDAFLRSISNCLRQSPTPADESLEPAGWSVTSTGRSVTSAGRQVDPDHGDASSRARRVSA